jgi:uncharacterized protein (DUF1800 family)
MKFISRECAWIVASATILLGSAQAQEALPEVSLSITNGITELELPLVSGVDEFQVLASTNLGTGFSPEAGSMTGYHWQADAAQRSAFFQVRMTPKDSNAVLSATLLNRLAYGPTPDELERLAQIGPQSYIEEQLAPEKISESLAIDQVNTATGWQHVVATGTASSSVLYIYLKGGRNLYPDDCYIDDIVLVSGTNAETGVNTVTNGGFEAGLTGWTVSTNLTNSTVVTDVHHSGTSALHVVSTKAGTTKSSSIWRSDLHLASNKPYTLSFWFHPGSSTVSDLEVRLSGSGITAIPGNTATRLAQNSASLSDLATWHILHAVQSRRQLLEVLLQFFENHFVTQESKSRDYMDQYYDGSETDWQAANLEYREIQRWRAALLNPACTFYDLLKISAESPAMIIYLDTVNSKGNGKNIANENYARELMELFTFGVDNGYDQNDITITSRAWSGWSIRLVDESDLFNPFAAQSTTLRPLGTNVAKINNLEGIWAFNYKAANHNTNSKTIFPGKTVPARFGPPYAGQNYELKLAARNGTNSIQDGYEVIAHLANQPFTQEFISVKLCRVFVHDDFATGYDFTDPNLSAEGKLVRACMQAWEENMPKGQIRKVLEVIFNSDLFRSQAGSMQKVKTPLEFTVSAVRALRADAGDGTFTADTDGTSIISPLNRMGSMKLFDRDTPDGYPEVAAPWISAGTLTERLRFAQSLLIPKGQSGKTDAGAATGADPVKLLKLKLPQASWHDAASVASYFAGILFPAEGKANLSEYVAQAISYLNTADDGVASSAFSSLSDTASTYDLRVRGMVAMLMTFPRFQEQ